MAGLDDERFEVLEHLGSGGFAHTYKVRVLDAEMVEEYGTPVVAIKVPLNAKKERLLRKEVEMNARLHIDLAAAQSINIVRYLGFEVFHGQIVMVMEFCDGNLRGRIGRIGFQKPLPEEEIVEIAAGVLNGMSAMHKVHVLHRDLKPENILMQGCVPKISDLGIARMLESNELASTTTGTVYYMAPEILCDEGGSFSADIWSLGVTLYEMTTGKLPFGGPTTPIGTMIDLIRGGPHVSASQVRPGIAENLSQVIDRALEKDPARRYRTADEMRLALTQAHEPAAGSVEEPPCAVEDSVAAGRG